VTSGASVLVIEDDDDTRSALVEVLLLENIRAIGAQDGAAAIDRFHNGLRPAVIVLDLGLPLVNGEQFLKARRLDPALANIPVVVITGREAKAEDFAGMNVKDVLRKPFDPWRIVEVVRPFCVEGGISAGASPNGSLSPPEN
jgi:DNA-binding response OmpR family regulator